MGLQRVQDWNVSRKELQELVHAGVLTQAEVEEVISIEFNPVSDMFVCSPPFPDLPFCTFRSC